MIINNIFKIIKEEKYKAMPAGRQGRKGSLSPSSGFTLIETLVAIAVLMIAIAGPLTVAEKGLSASIYAKNQTTATYLAQDAMEYVRNIVDTNELNKYSGVDWLSVNAGIFFTSVPSLSSCTPSNPCRIDTVQGGITNCSPSVSLPSDPKSCILYLGLNGYQPWQNVGGASQSSQTVNFSRSFYVIEPTSSINSDSNAMANVVINVTWPGQTVGGGGVTLVDTLFNVLQ